MTKRATNSYNAFELLCISAGVEQGDTLLAQDEDGKESRYLWTGHSDRYSVFVYGEDGTMHRFFTASLEDKFGHMIVGLSDKPLVIGALQKQNGGVR